jgi:conjugal transfer pilus assembly protein TraE
VARSLSELQGDRRFLIYANLVLGVLLLLLLGLVFASDTRVVLVPPELAGEVWITPDDASADYKKSWALMTATVLGNVTPATAEDVQKTLVALIAPEAYREIQLDLSNQVKMIQTDSLSVSFTPKQRVYEDDTDKIFVTGTHTVTGPSGDQREAQRTYEFRIQIRLGVPQVTHFDVYEGRPRTSDITRREAQVDEGRRERESGAHDAN